MIQAGKRCQRSLCELRFVTLCLSMYSTTGWAADWRYEPRVEGAAGYGQNVNLSRDPELKNNTTPIYWLTSENDLIAESPSSRTLMSADVRLRRFPDQDDLDSDAYLFDVETVKTTLRDEFELAAWYYSDSTVFTQLTDTGETQENRQQEELGVSPAWTRSLSQQTSLQLTYELSDVSFEQGEFSSGLQDYQNQLFHARLVRTLSGRRSIFAGARYFRYDTDDDTVQTDTAILSAGFDQSFTQRWTGHLEIGWRWLESENFMDIESPIVASDSGPAFDGELTWRSLRQRLTFSASRTIEPSAAGNVTEVQLADVTYQNDISRTATVTVSALASDTDFGLTDQPNRKYYNMSVALIWRFQPRWEAEISYRYERQQFETLDTDTDELDDSADGQQALFTLRYRWIPIRFR